MINCKRFSPTQAACSNKQKSMDAGAWQTFNLFTKTTLKALMAFLVEKIFEALQVMWNHEQYGFMKKQWFMVVESFNRNPNGF